jgi:hypothetical protein
MVTRRRPTLCIFADMPRPYARASIRARVLDRTPIRTTAGHRFAPACPLHLHVPIVAHNTPLRPAPRSSTRARRINAPDTWDMPLGTTKLVALRRPSDWRGNSQCGLLLEWSTRRRVLENSHALPSLEKMLPAMMP